MQIAFLACPGTLPGSPSRRYDAFEHDYQIAALREGLAGRATVTDIDWRASLEELTRFDYALIGTAWDYTYAKDEFLARLEALEAAGVKVCNSSAVVRWNSDKHYLRDLAERGAATIPTLWPKAVTTADVEAAFCHFECAKLVVKRRVGSGAEGQECFARGELLPEGWTMDQPALLQPFLPAIQGEGELSFIFVGGALSHALTKQAQPGEYRIQSNFGGIETAIAPEPEDRAAAEAVMAMLPFAEAPLYARIDMVRLNDGALAVMEAELIEPYLYPLQGPDFGAMLAEAVLRRR
jgi:glutathione synthase/RimK-type ligase-like ATP-grasp enzyme